MPDYPESPEHLYQKQRVRDIARNEGYIAINEVPFWCWSGFRNRAICYSVDTFIINREAKTIIVEIDGHKGHLSKYQSGRDVRRTEDIRAMWGDNIVVLRFTLSELEEATDEDIKEDLGIG